MPLLSVILPVYNGLPYLRQAIESVLSQSFKDYELLIIDDGSTDGSEQVVAKLDDPRIRYVQQGNRGLAATLNRALSLAAGKYIARQDQDDVCFPLRFRRQVEFLGAHPEVGLLGTAAEIWVGNTRTQRKLAHPTDNAALKFAMLFNNYLVHSSVMIRRSVLDEIGGYSEDKQRQPPEDYELWSRVIRKYRVANLPDVLLAYREVPTSMSRAGVNPFLPNLLKISAENIAWASGYPQEAAEVIALSRLSQGLPDGIPSGVGFSRLKALIDAAVQNIARDAGVPEQSLADARRARLRRLGQQYLNFRTGGLLGKLVNGPVGHALKKAAGRAGA